MVKKIIITGGPGTGKTSLIEELKKITSNVSMKFQEKLL